jgi:hypothetical protein
MKNQCEAVTLASTYSQSHRCLKKAGIKRLGKRRLCLHHRNFEARRQP